MKTSLHLLLCCLALSMYATAGDVITVSVSPTGQSGSAPYIADFEGIVTSSSAVTSWAWTFTESPYSGCVGFAGQQSGITCPLTIAHTYNNAGTYTVYFLATDNDGQVAQTTSTITVNASSPCAPNLANVPGVAVYTLPSWITALNFTGPADVIYGGSVYKHTTASGTQTWLPHGTVGAPYCMWLNAGGGRPPYMFSATGLPPQIEVSEAGQITGTATLSGNYTINFKVTDAEGNVATLLPRWIEVCTIDDRCNGFGN